ncbi:serine/threonine protein kinase [Roseiconus nitratireducens]|uniref:non-specific serine/threonine protein kinase n=1 Tax=Roseiconus nitratireducens TaxID=2605748 RepID=A0A5M6CYA0_9BACT|nr:protein kinase [Roseiconus nitratireducens]KAA5540184.1 serine/threonine protein kinase [Roseiconus nitratireducens]
MSEGQNGSPGQPSPDQSVGSPPPASQSAASQSAASLIGTRLAGYLILSRLGRGGMADVYSARDVALDRDVAIKVLRQNLANDRDYIARFRREAKAAAKLNHPNIVQIYEVGEDASRYYIAQELISGVNLHEWLDRNGVLSPDQAIEILYGVTSALDAAASEGITHRDIKPENVMWSKTGSVKVADFGLARLGNERDTTHADLTQAGLTLGTPRYMSPEQVQGRPVDPRSDLYSLGVMMYHLLTGRPPFEADDPLALAFAHVNETPVPLDRARGNKDVPEWLIAIIAKLMRKDPKDRFQSPAELLEALTGDAMDQRTHAKQFAGAASATAHLQRIADTQRRLRSRKRMQAVAIMLVPLLFVVLGAAVVAQVQRPTVAKMLRPDVVPQADSVEAQFLDAVHRNDVAGWNAVAKYFPPAENAANRSYATKAAFQLARYYESEGGLKDADTTLEQLLNDPGLGRKYRLLAWAWRVRILQAIGRPEAVNEAKRQLEAVYADLKTTNPNAVRWFDRMIPPSEQSALGLTRETGNT